MKKILKSCTAVILAVIFLTALASCTSYNESDSQYWFSSFEKTFVSYDENAGGSGNLDEAGTYWKMTMARDCEVSLYVINDSLSMFSGTYFYLNGEQIPSDDPGVYSFAYKNLTLKKGDELILHGFWTNGLKTDDTGFSMSHLIMENETGAHLVSDIKS